MSSLGRKKGTAAPPGAARRPPTALSVPAPLSTTSSASSTSSSSLSSKASSNRALARFRNSAHRVKEEVKEKKERLARLVDRIVRDRRRMLRALDHTRPTLWSTMKGAWTHGLHNFERNHFAQLLSHPNATVLMTLPEIRHAQDGRDLHSVQFLVCHTLAELPTLLFAGLVMGLIDWLDPEFFNYSEVVYDIPAFREICRFWPMLVWSVIISLYSLGAHRAAARGVAAMHRRSWSSPSLSPSPSAFPSPSAAAAAAAAGAPIPISTRAAARTASETRRPFVFVAPRGNNRNGSSIQRTGGEGGSSGGGAAPAQRAQTFHIPQVFEGDPSQQPRGQRIAGSSSKGLARNGSLGTMIPIPRGTQSITAATTSNRSSTSSRALIDSADAPGLLHSPPAASPLSRARTTLTRLTEIAQSSPYATASLLTGLGSSLLAGVIEELGYRWLYIHLTMVILFFVDKVLLSDVVLQCLFVAASLWSAVNLLQVLIFPDNRLARFKDSLVAAAIAAVALFSSRVHENIFFAVLHWVATAFDKLASYVHTRRSERYLRTIFGTHDTHTLGRVDDLFAYAAIIVNFKFQDGHKHQRALGRLNAFCCGLVFVYAAVTYGLTCAIAVHAAYDAVCHTIAWLMSTGGGIDMSFLRKDLARRNMRPGRE
jgi:hypothetical protein